MFQGAPLLIVMSDNKLATYFTENPRMIGVLFTILLLLSQAGNVAAANIGTCAGP